MVSMGESVVANGQSGRVIRIWRDEHDESKVRLFTIILDDRHGNQLSIVPMFSGMIGEVKVIEGVS